MVRCFFLLKIKMERNADYFGFLSQNYSVYFVKKDHQKRCVEKLSMACHAVIFKSKKNFSEASNAVIFMSK